MVGSRLFWKLYLGYVVLVAVTAGVVGVLIGRGIETEVLDQTRRELSRGGAVLRELVRSLPEELSPDERRRIQATVLRLGRDTGIRFTLIAGDGVVVADSDEDPARMDDHSERPEVLQAAAEGEGIATRVSATLGTRMMYLAMPTASGEGWVRAAMPLAEIDERRARLRKSLLLGAVIASGAALLIGLPFGRHFTSPFVKMSHAARSIAAGKYQGRLEIGRHDEIGAFAQAFNVMAAALEDRIGTLTEERNRVISVLGSMVEGVVAVDARRDVILMNAPAGEILGADIREARGRPLGSLTRVLEVAEALSDTLASGVDRSREIRLPARDGERVLEVHTSPIRGTEDGTAGAVVVLHDVTELRRLEGVRRDFVANVSHELKTPLTVVRGIIETMLDDDRMDDATRGRFLKKAGDQTDRLTAIVADLLTIAQVEATGNAPERTVLDLREPARESFRALVPSADTRGVSIEAELPDAPLPVRGDHASLRLVIDNLLDNAVKYTRAGGRVWLRLFPDAKQAVIEVADTGIGIESRHGDRIFERFYRVDKARSRELGGTGLGLSIVRNVILAHEGHLDYESAPEEGATFRIRLPLHTGASLTLP